MSSGKRKLTDDEPEVTPEEYSDDPRKFLDRGSVNKHLFCSVCSDVFKDPQRAPCGHSFCQECIVTWLQKSRSCPVDRRPLFFADLHHDFILKNIVEDEIVACPHRPFGCEMKYPIHLMKTHMRKCEFNSANMTPYLRAFLMSKMAERAKDKQNSPSSTVTSDAQETPAQPSLLMRLFRAGSRNMLKALFEKKNNK